MIDAQLLFSDAQAITASAASTNLVDLRAARRIAVGRPLFFVAQVTTAFTDAGSDSTVAVTIESDTTSAFSSATTIQTIGTFGALSAVGSRFIVALQDPTTAEQYIRAYYTVANGNLTTGKITAFLTDNPSQWAAYPAGHSIQAFAG